jgi:hypothetical protein
MPLRRTLMSVRSSFCARLLCLSGFLAIMGCGAGASVGPGPGPGPGPNPDTVWTTLVGVSDTLSGGHEAYRCAAVQASTDLYIKAFRTVATPGHYRAIVTVTDTAPPAAGTYDCNSFDLLRQRMIYASGIGTDDMLFPSGTGIHVKAGQYVYVQEHQVNHGSADLGVTTTIMIRKGTAADVTSEAEMIFAGTFNIAIPSDDLPHAAGGGCVSSYTQQLLAILPLMNGIATHQQVSLPRVSGTQTLLDADYDLNHDPFHPMTGVTIQQGDQIHVQCTYVNNTGHVMSYSDSSAGESCFSGLYLVPSAGQTLLACMSM